MLAVFEGMYKESQDGRQQSCTSWLFAVNLHMMIRQDVCAAGLPMQIACY